MGRRTSDADVLRAVIALESAGECCGCPWDYSKCLGADCRNDANFAIRVRIDHDVSAKAVLAREGELDRRRLLVDPGGHLEGRCRDCEARVRPRGSDVQSQSLNNGWAQQYLDLGVAYERD